MNYYLDFEATQFSNRIISIGCVCETGETFYSLVKPIKGKITKFITKLTGITKEDLATAPEPEVVFSQFRRFIQATSQKEETFFFVYGNADETFLKQTIKFIDNYSICQFGNYLTDSLIDFSAYTREFFKVGDPPSLKRVYKFLFSDESAIQTHNALDDALWLQKVAIKINNSTPYETTPEEFKPKENNNNEYSNYNIIAIPDEKMLEMNPDAQKKVYISMSVAVDTLYAKALKNNPNTKRDNIRKSISRAINRGTTYHSRYWKRELKKKGNNE